MNKIFKNLIITMAALSVCVVGMLVTTAHADAVRTLSMKLMGVGNAPDPSSSVKRLTGDEGEFWVGVTADNLDDSIADHELFTNGVHTLEISFEYDTTYILPYTEGTDPDAAWNNAIISGNLKSGVGTDDAEWWDDTSYTVTSCRETDINENPYRKGYPDESSTRAASGSTWKMCTVTIRYSGSDFTKARFKGLTDDTSEKILIKVPFRLVTAPPEGTTVYPLALVRGPETFDMGASENGFTPHYEWYHDSTYKTDENLKLLFDDKTDNLNLFGVGAAITNIEYNEVLPTPEPSASPLPEQSPKPLSKTYTPAMGNEGYDAEVYGSANPYYITVPNDSESITLRIEAAGAPDVTYDDGSSSGLSIGIASSVSQVHTTDPIALTELDPDTKDTDNGFLNKVTVSDGTRDYVIFIRRLIKPKIVLNYGNSPVGMIMSDDTTYPTQTDKETAIDDFKTSRTFDGVTSGLTYYANAWLSYPVTIDNGDGTTTDTYYDGDEDPTSIFIFQRQSFRDPGFVGLDAMGEAIDGDDVNISITVTSFKGGFVNYNSSDNPSDVEINVSGNNYLFTELNDYDLVPNVYDMTYTFTDDSGNTATATRKVIIISRRGDVVIDANKAVNNIDASNIISHNAYFMNSSVNSLYKFRIGDTVTDANKAVNNIDASYIIAHVTSGIAQFYKALPFS